MMWRHCLLFALAFSIEIRVHATQILSLPEQKEILQQPADCLKGTEPCALRTEPGSKYVVELAAAHIIMGGDTAILRTSEHSVHLLKGEIWVQTGEDFSVASEYGNISGAADFWVTRRDHNILTRAIGGDVEIALRGTEEILLVKQGQENWLGAVNKKGVSTSGIPRTIELQDHLQHMAKLYVGDKANFRTQILNFLKVWRQQVNESAQLQKELVTRELASTEEQKKREVERQREIQKQNQAIRALFRHRNFLDL